MFEPEEVFRYEFIFFQLLMVLERSLAFATAFCKRNVRRLTLALCGDDESCMWTLTVSGQADERKVRCDWLQDSFLPRG